MFTGKAVAALVEKRGRGRPRKNPQSIVIKPPGEEKMVKPPEEKPAESKMKLTKEAAMDVFTQTDPVTPSNSPVSTNPEEPRKGLEKLTEKKKIMVIKETSGKAMILCLKYVLMHIRSDNGKLSLKEELQRIIERQRKIRAEQKEASGKRETMFVCLQ